MTNSTFYHDGFSDARSGAASSAPDVDVYAAEYRAGYRDGLTKESADNLTTSAAQPAQSHAIPEVFCGHTITADNCSSWSRDTGFHPRPCENCKQRSCDNCSDHWSVCVSCGGGICHGCALTARSRSVTDAPAYGAPCRTRTEFLCTRCATSQDVTVKAIAASLVGIGTDEDGRWLSDIVSDLEDALSAAKKAL